MDRYLSIGEAARMKGVSITTLRRWEADGTLVPIRTKGGRRRLLAQIVDGKEVRLVIMHKDRLLSFGAKPVFAVCEAKSVEVEIVNKGEGTSFKEDLAKDVPEILTVFSARLYGSRSRKNQKLIDAVKKTAEDAQG